MKLPQWNDKEFKILSAPVDPSTNEMPTIESVWAPSERVAIERFAETNPNRYVKVIASNVIYF